MSRPLDPDELRRLLEDATAEIRPGPEAYNRIRDGIRHQSPWTFRLVTAGVLAAAAVGGALFAGLQHTSSQSVDALPSGLTAGHTSTVTTEPRGGSSTGTGATGGSPSQAGPTSGSVRPTVRPTVSATTGTGPVTATPSSPAGIAPTAPPVSAGRTGDLDGDGKADIVSAAPGSLTVTLTKVPRTEHVAVPDAAVAPAANVSDFDHDHLGEVLVRVTEANPTSTYQVAQLVAGELTLVPQQLYAGADATHGDGFSCTAGGDITTVAGDSTDGGHVYVGTTTTYALTGATLTVVSPAAPWTVDLSQPATVTPFTAGCGAPPVG